MCRLRVISIRDKPIANWPIQYVRGPTLIENCGFLGFPARQRPVR
jgi:hypothetical protein